MLRIATLSLCAALLAASPALAATPKAGKRYAGPTSQGKRVAVRAGSDAKAVRTFFIRWSVRCPTGKTTLTYRAQAKLERLKLGPRGGFAGTVFYKDSNLGKGYSANVFVRLAGRFTSSSLATGRWRGAVRLFKSGKQVAYCRSARISWRAELGA